MRGAKRPQGGTMRYYETTLITRPGLNETAYGEILDRVRAIIANGHGAIVKEDDRGIRKLAYQIKKESQARYTFIRYGAPVDAVDEIERIFRIDDRVLRYLTIKLDDTFDAAACAAAEEENTRQHSAEDSASVNDNDVDVADDDADSSNDDSDV